MKLEMKVACVASEKWDSMIFSREPFEVEFETYVRRVFSSINDEKQLKSA